jgi:uncharacterized protein (DUF1330 family)
MAAWLIVDVEITDPAAYEAYKVAARPIAERHGGAYRVRGGALEVVDAALWTPTRLVLIEFPDMAAARAFLDDPDYAPVKAIRHAAARSTLVLAEGL